MQKALKLWAHLHTKFLQFAVSTFIHHPAKHKTKHKYTKIQQRNKTTISQPIYFTNLCHILEASRPVAYLQLALNNENDLNQFTLKQLFEVISSSSSNFLVTHGLKSFAAKTQSHQENSYQVSSQA